MRLIVQKVDRASQTFTCKMGNQIVSFYLTNRLAKIFLNHLSEDVLVDFEITKGIRKINKVKSHQVAYFNLIKNYKQNIVIYDHKQLKLDMIGFLEKNKYYLFMDLEMTIPFYRQKDFIPEIIQYGYLLVDKNGNTILENGNYVKTKLQKNINKRTKQFLDLDLDIYNDTKITYEEFYNEIKAIMNKYNPKVVVWGKNDIQALNYGYQIYDVKPLTTEKDFVDLLKLHKDYFNLSNDLGLFKAYETYYEKSVIQTHDAKDDAIVTKKVFDAFIKYTAEEHNLLK